MYHRAALNMTGLAMLPGQAAWQQVSLRARLPRPWKNGGGLTRELLAWPSAQDWVWRMSVAEVAGSGPFSSFKSVQRWFAVLSGAGVQLTIGSEVGLAAQTQTHTLTAISTPLCFAGDAPVQCTLLDGPTQDFNLMLRQGRASARMVRVSGDFSSTLSTTKIVAAYAIDTSASVQFDHEVLQLPADTLAWRQCPPGAALQAHAAHALWMEIEP